MTLIAVLTWCKFVHCFAYTIQGTVGASFMSYLISITLLHFRPGINGDGGMSWGRDDPEYYNDLPGKVPPDLPPPPVPPLPQYSASESKRPVLASPASTPAPSVASSSPVPAPTQSLANSHQTLSSKGICFVN